MGAIIFGDQGIANGGQAENPVIIDFTGVKAFCVRKDADGGDVFVVDTANEAVIISTINGINIGASVSEDIDLITVEEGSADAGKPKFWYEQSTDSFRMDRSLILPGGSLVLGSHKMSESTLEDDDGWDVVGSLHIRAYPDGKAGNVVIHEGTEPITGAGGDSHRLWADDIKHNILWQDHLGVSRIVHTEGGAAPGQWLLTGNDISYSAGNVSVDKNFSIINGFLAVNSIEIVGSDGEVNKAVVEDSANWDAAYGWGDHLSEGYLTSEADPIFSAWDKSTGIIITENQISDLQSYLTSESDPVFTAWDKSTGISITESQISDLSHFSNSEAIAAIEGEATLLFQQPTTISTKTGGGILVLESEGNSLHLKAGIDIRVRQDVLFYDNNLFWVGSSKDYWFYYSTSSTRFVFKSKNIDGVPSEGTIFRIQDGTQDVEFLGAVKTDTINEFTADAGVTVDSVLLKDGTVDGVDIAGLSASVDNVDNTSDVDKPVSTAQQAALDLKAPLESPAFTGSIFLPDGSSQVVASRPNGSGWDCTTAKYKQTFPLVTWGTGPHCAAFRPDGRKVFVVDNTSEDINEFTLSTPWDVSTMTFSYTKDVGAQESNPQGICFNITGTKMYFVGAGGDEVNEYNLSTAWDLSTASPSQLKDLSGSSTTPMGIQFSPSGLKMFISDGSLDEIQLWTLTTPWDVTTASYTTKFDASMDNIEGFCFSPDGRRLYVVDGSAEDDIHEYHLSTPWDITTGAYIRSLDLTGITDVPNSVTFSLDGTKMYVTDNDTGVDGLLEFDIGLSTLGDVDVGGALKHKGSTVGFYNKTPVTQPLHIADADGTLADITTKFNALLAQVASLGLQAAL